MDSLNAFTRLGEAHRIRPIPSCPGRFYFTELPPATPLTALLPEGIEAHPWRVAAARDEVWVAAIEGGGLISYQRPDGTWVHTLNTPWGFERKLRQLGIPLPDAATRQP